jgi:hypothetical protein
VTTQAIASAVQPTEIRRPLWQPISLWVIGLVILFLYSGIWRPIWLDEFLHYAMGGMTLDYALKTIDYTTIEVNHGQTGVYMLLDWLLMQVFGASSIGLRLPSLISAGVMLAAAVTFVRLRGLAYPWQVLVLLSLAAHSFLMWFVAEARPYLPLAAATVATLAYYQYSVASRRRWLPLAYGVFGIVIGALMHPYIVYLAAVIVPFSVWVAVRDGRLSWGVRDIIRFANPILLGAGAAVFLVIGELTWMRRIASFGYGPFDLMGSGENAFWAFITDHFTNRPTSAWWIALLAVVTLGGLALARFRGIGPLLPPLVLLVLGLASSAIVSALSAMRTYWILERQWVAGIALVAISGVWFFAEMHKASQSTTSRRDAWALKVPVALFVALTVASSLFVLWHTASEMIAQRDAYAKFTSETRSMDELRPAQINDDDGYIYAANVNIARGGPVWPMFVDWYDNLAGMRPEFREKNPSWSGFLGDQRTLNNG